MPPFPLKKNWSKPFTQKALAFNDPEVENFENIMEKKKNVGIHHFPSLPTTEPVCTLQINIIFARVHSKLYFSSLKRRGKKYTMTQS